MGAVQRLEGGVGGPQGLLPGLQRLFQLLPVDAHPLQAGLALVQLLRGGAAGVPQLLHPAASAWAKRVAWSLVKA